MIKKRVAMLLLLVVSLPFCIFADETNPDGEISNITIPERSSRKVEPKAGKTTLFVAGDSIDRAGRLRITPEPADTSALAADSIQQSVMNASLAADSLQLDSIPKEFSRRRNFNLNPTRAVWLSALCPGLGQIYNRRYWKLPIVVGGFVGLSYATSWNNRMLTDYTKAYRDIMDSDPPTKSYMDFFPPNTKESEIDEAWLKKSLKSKKNFYRRNRDLCIIGMVGLYLINIVDAYVDATLSHFDISPDLSLQVAPTVLGTDRVADTSPGIRCALTF